MYLYINQEWTFKELVRNIETLKYQYNKILASFIWYETRKRNNFMRTIKKDIYNLRFEEWKKDKAWECLNGFEEIAVLKSIAERVLR